MRDHGASIQDGYLATLTRLTIAEELGHGRAQITNAYCGKAAKVQGDALEQRRLDGSETQRRTT